MDEAFPNIITETICALDMTRSNCVITAHPNNTGRQKQVGQVGRIIICSWAQVRYMVGRQVRRQAQFVRSLVCTPCNSIIWLSRPVFSSSTPPMLPPPLSHPSSTSATTMLHTARVSIYYLQHKAGFGFALTIRHACYDDDDVLLLTLAGYIIIVTYSSLHCWLLLLLLLLGRRRRRCRRPLSRAQLDRRPTRYVYAADTTYTNV